MAEEMKDKDQTLENGQEARETTEETGTASQTEETPEEKDGGVGEEPQTEKKGFFGKKKDKKDKKDIQIEELTDKLKRQMAEFDNFRKRTEKEKASMFEVGARSVVEKVLPIVDNFERGLGSVSEDQKEDPFVAEWRRFISSSLPCSRNWASSLSKRWDRNSIPTSTMR